MDLDLCAGMKKPRRGGAWGATGCPARRHQSSVNWRMASHHPEVARWLQFAPASVTDDIRTIARNFVRWKLGTKLPVLRNPAATSTPATAPLQAIISNGLGMIIDKPQKQTVSAVSCENPQASATVDGCFSKVMTPLRKPTRITSFGPKRPSRICLASGFSSWDWIARFSGRAP